MNSNNKNISKKQGCLGCGCLLFILLFFAGCVGACTSSFNEVEKTEKTNKISDDNIKNKEKEIKEKQKEIEKKEKKLKDKEDKKISTTKEKKNEYTRSREQQNQQNNDSTNVSTEEAYNNQDRNSFYHTQPSTEESTQINERSNTSSNSVRNYDDDSNKGTGTPSASYYPNCTAAREAGAAPISIGQPGYGTHLDRDGDGIGCDK